jgi:hypothetical protein
MGACLSLPASRPNVRAEHSINPFREFLRSAVGHKQTSRPRPEIEGRAAPQIETGMMPMAGEDPVFDAAAMEGKAHMRTPVIERDHVASATTSTALGCSPPLDGGRVIRRGAGANKADRIIHAVPPRTM